MPEEPARLCSGLPPTRLRIGVSGHRGAPKLSEGSLAAVRARVDWTIAAVRDATGKLDAEMVRSFYGDASRTPAVAGEPRKAPSFTIISALAEGADRIVAEAGLAASFTLEAVLPFARSEYAKDFETPESRQAFDELLAHSVSVFELDGDVRERPRAYEAAGLVMLSNIDLLIAIWDGEEAAGIGGTAQIVSRAVADGIPVVWIEPLQPDAVRLSWPRPGELPLANGSARPKAGFHLADASDLAQTIIDILSPPTQSERKRSLQLYLGECERRWNFCAWYPLLLWVFGGRPPRPSEFRLPPALTETQKQWAPYFSILPKDDAQRPAIESTLLPAYSATDHLAVYYSLIYRSTYVFDFLFAAVAVMLALFGVFFHNPVTKVFFVVPELLVIIAILLTWRRGHRRQWHRRWLDYRRLAECLRHMRILAPIGSGGPIDRPGRNLDVDEQDWVNWYAWSLRRLIPLPHCAVDAAYLQAVREAVRSVEVRGQIDYHIGTADRIGNAQRIARLDHNMHCWGWFLFGGTLVICTGFALIVGLINAFGLADPRPFTLQAITFVTALLPTFGAALSAIHVQGDFKTVSEQSKRTGERLAAIDKILEQEPLELARLTDRIEKTSDIMMADLLEWQTVFRTRPLSLPA